MKLKLSLQEIVQGLREGGMRCNCDLDNWQPEIDTGHSWVCRIHKKAKALHERNVSNLSLERTAVAGSVGATYP